MLILLPTLVLAAAIVWGVVRVTAEMRAARDEAARTRALTVLSLFAPAAGAAASDPRAILVWEPLARVARRISPAEFAQLDAAAGTPFPFSPDRIQAAHAQWTTEWLAWERTHDAEFKLKAAAAEEEMHRPDASPLARARLDAVEREKLDSYQRRYEEYVRIAKALQALVS